MSRSLLKKRSKGEPALELELDTQHAYEDTQNEYDFIQNEYEDLLLIDPDLCYKIKVLYELYNDKRFSSLDREDRLKACREEYEKFLEAEELCRPEDEKEALRQ